jgi:hypothetical protein
MQLRPVQVDMFGCIYMTMSLPQWKQLADYITALRPSH